MSRRITPPDPPEWMCDEHREMWLTWRDNQHLPGYEWPGNYQIGDPIGGPRETTRTWREKNEARMVTIEMGCQRVCRRGDDDE